MTPRQRERHKRELLLEYAEDHDLRIFVETGTYKGDTVKFMLDTGHFDQIHTIDVYTDRVDAAQKRFEAFDNVHCWRGDSGKEMPKILDYVTGPALFWLDAHHSGGQIARSKGLINTPIIAELEYVLEHEYANRHVVLIDDTRYFEEFGGKYEGYPTEDEVREVVSQRLDTFVFSNEDDILRIYNPRMQCG